MVLAAANDESLCDLLFGRERGEMKDANEGALGDALALILI
jgi:hypothetical protein